MTKLGFENIKSSLDPISRVFNTMARGADLYRIEISDAKDINKENELYYKRKVLLKEIKEVENSKFMLDSTQREELKELNEQLNIVKSKLGEIHKINQFHW